MTDSTQQAQALREQVVAIVNSFSGTIRDKYIFFAPSFPPKKLQNVLGSYAAGARGERILAMVDNTAFGGAKDGALLTDVRIYAHNQMEAPLMIDLSAIQTAVFVEGLAGAVYINGVKFLETHFPDRYAMRVFTSMLQRIADLFHAPAEPTKSPTEALKELKELLDAGIITEEEYQLKRQQYLAQL